MSMRLFIGVMSTNRPEYLFQTLQAIDGKLDTTGFSVDKLVIDDYPRGRDPVAMSRLCYRLGFEFFGHASNLGLGPTWAHLWRDAIMCEADFILHVEDDAVLQHPISVAELAAAADPLASQMVLTRQAWYSHEAEPGPETTDHVVPGQFRVGLIHHRLIFSPMFSLYPIDRAKFDYRRWYRETYPNEPKYHTEYPNEGLVGKCLWERDGLSARHVKTLDGQPFIKHVGEYTRGRRLHPGEAGYENFAHYDPNRNYCSRTGRLI